MTELTLSSVFEPHLLEQKIYKLWEDQGCFVPSGDGEPYCIMIPPPNVTGSLHMGHAFQNTLMDALIRYHRMKGRNTLWQVGTDHAGIATQMVVERLLNRDGISRSDLGRDKFIDKVWEWKANSGGTITNQLRRLGASLDWSRERFTMDEDLSTAVQEVFVRLYEEGLIYRGNRLVNWDPVLLTAISDLEVMAEEEAGNLWHFKYPITDSSDYVVIATTRPETMLGDTAVAVHPEDKRYSHLVGKTVELPLVGRKIPIITDTYVDPDFGSGCVKITPAHDFNDYEVGKRHDLELVNIMTPNADIHLPGSPYHGLSRSKARNKILEDLTQLDLIAKVEEHQYMVPRGDRTGQVIEPYLTDQWFVRTKTLAESAIEAVRDESIQFVPSNWEKTYFEWMENIEDWCISRQIWWGHRIPAWYDDQGRVFVARSEKQARQQAQQIWGDKEFSLRQDEDVLDTWFSSALWPFSTLGWPHQTDELQTFYPTSVLVTGFDIIFFWVARMIMFGLKFADDIPFHEVYIHGLVRDSEGQKMSKSKGNILDPLDLIDGIELEQLLKKRTTGLMQPELAPKIEAATRQQFPQGIPAHGTDALRFTFARLATQGRDIRFDLGVIEGYRKFCNKLWNAARFVLMNTKATEFVGFTHHKPIASAEKWIIHELHQTIEVIEKSFAVYRFDLASKQLYEFVWNEYCAWFIEIAKALLNHKSTDSELSNSIRQTLLAVLDASIRLLHPFMPFITEEIWRSIHPHKHNQSIMFEPFCDDLSALIDSYTAAEIEWLKAVVTVIRNLRSEVSIKPGQRITVYYERPSQKDRGFLAEYEFLICKLAQLKSIEPTNQVNLSDSNSISALAGDMRLLVRVDQLDDIEQKLMRVTKELKAASIALEKSQTKLNNQQFLTKAPATIVAKEKQRLLELKKSISELKKQQAKLENFSTDSTSQNL